MTASNKTQNQCFRESSTLYYNCGLLVCHSDSSLRPVYNVDMKKLIVIPLLSCIILLSSCGGLSELSFVTIGDQTIAANGLDPTSRIEVVTQTPSSIQGILPVDLSALQSVDYSEDAIIHHLIKRTLISVICFSRKSNKNGLDGILDRIRIVLI